MPACTTQTGAVGARRQEAGMNGDNLIHHQPQHDWYESEEQHSLSFKRLAIRPQEERGPPQHQRGAHTHRIAIVVAGVEIRQAIGCREEPRDAFPPCAQPHPGRRPSS